MPVMLVIFISLFAFRLQSQNFSNIGGIEILSGTLVSGLGNMNTSGSITNNGIIRFSGNLENAGTMEGGGTYYIGGNWTNNGIFNADTSTVIFYADDGQVKNIGGTTTPTEFYNIIIDASNGSEVWLLADQNIKSTMTLTNGIFNTNGFVFKLLSTVASTARIAEITGGNITGNITMQRYVDGNDGWRMLSGTVATNIEDWNQEFAMSGFPGTDQPGYSFTSFLKYNESAPGDKNQGYEDPGNTSDALTPGGGYMAWIGDAPGDPIVKTLDLKGPPNKFAQSISVTYTDDTGQPPTEDGWNLVGNPYPSSIDWDAAGWTKTNVNNTIYIWDDAIQVYKSYTTGGPNPGPNGGAPIIASMQGFWIQTNAASPVLSLNEIVKTTADQAFFKQAAPGEIILKLKILSQNGYADECFIRFIPGSDENFEGNSDAFKLFSGSVNPPQISSIINDSLDLCLNSLPELSENRIIPLRVKSKTSGNVSINVLGVNDIPPGYCVLLKDEFNGSICDLRTDTAYSFFLSDTTGFPRFSLHLLKNDSIPCAEQISIMSKANDLLNSENHNIYYTVDDRRLTVYLDYTASTVSAINVYNLLGDKIIPEIKGSYYKSRVSIDLSNYSQAIYFLFVSVPGHNYTQKFFLR